MCGRLCRGDRGETLLELVVAIAILGVSVVAIGLGIAGASRVTATHRQNSTALYWLHNAAETLQSAYDSSCSPAYAGKLPGKPDSSFGPPTVTVKYWDATNQNFDLSACPNSGGGPVDPGAQEITINLSTADGTSSNALTVVLRNQS